MMNDIGCTPQSIQQRTIYSIQSLNQSETTLSLTRFSLNYARNTTLTLLYFSSMAPHRFKTLVLDTASITDMKNMVIGTASNVSFVK